MGIANSSLVLALADNLTPQDVAGVFTGASPTQIITMIFIGVICACLLFLVVKFYLDARIADLPENINAIKESLHQNALTMESMKAKLWSEDKIKQTIDAAITKHALECPARNFHCREVEKKNI